MGGEVYKAFEEDVLMDDAEERLSEEEMVPAVVQGHKKYSVLGGVPPPMKVVVVGYALTSKKVKSFLQPKLEGLARNKGILFVAIDHTRPLSDQGPFDIVLHKLSGKEWHHVLEVSSSIRKIAGFRKLVPEVYALHSSRDRDK